MIDTLFPVMAATRLPYENHYFIFLVARDSDTPIILVIGLARVARLE